jgi:hypothetical protein
MDNLCTSLYIKKFNELLEKNDWDDINRFFIDCCNHGTLEDIKYMIECGVNPHMNEDEAFVRSCSRNDPAIGKYLLTEHNANINAQYDGPAKLASVQMMKILLECGIVITNEIIREHIWTEYPECSPMIKLFLEYGIDREKIAEVFFKWNFSEQNSKTYFNILKILSDDGTDFNQVIQQIVKK